MQIQGIRHLESTTRPCHSAEPATRTQVRSYAAHTDIADFRFILRRPHMGSARRVERRRCPKRSRNGNSYLCDLPYRGTRPTLSTDKKTSSAIICHYRSAENLRCRISDTFHEDCPSRPRQSAGDAKSGFDGLSDQANRRLFFEPL